MKYKPKIYVNEINLNEFSNPNSMIDNLYVNVINKILWIFRVNDGAMLDENT